MTVKEILEKMDTLECDLNDTAPYFKQLEALQKDLEEAVITEHRYKLKDVYVRIYEATHGEF